MEKAAYRRVVIKLSGEALAKKNASGHIDSIYDDDILSRLAKTIRQCVSLGVQPGIVIGAGNIWRGELGKTVERTRADHMGMLATMINCLRMQDALLAEGVDAVVMASVPMPGFAEVFDHKKAMADLENGKVVIFGGGIGIPFVSTDTATVVRAVEIGADAILMAKNINGVYTANPRDEDEKVAASAKRYKKVSYAQCLADNLQATDTSASAIAMEQRINMYVFGLSRVEDIVKAVSGEEIGTLVTYDSNAEAVLYE